MKGLALAALGVAALAAVEAGAATLFDSGGFAGPTYVAGFDLAGQDGWSGGVAPEGAAIGAGIDDFGGGDLFAYIMHADDTPGAYGVWTRDLAATTDPIISATWWQYVDGGSFGVGLYNGNNTVAAVEVGTGADWHQLQLDVSLPDNLATVMMDGSPVLSFATNGSQAVDKIGLIAWSGFGTGYFDDVLVVSSVPEPGILAIAVASAVLALPRRRAAQKLEIA